MDLRKLAETNDPRALKLIQHIFSWMIGMDMMENIANETEEVQKIGYEPKRELKQLNNKFNKSARDFNKALKKELGNDLEAESFGDSADFLHELISIAMFVKPEDRIKALSTIKLFVK